MQLRSAIPAGLVDTASAALATFIVQVAMIRYAAPDLLGIYAVFFGAFMVAHFITLLLFLRPGEVAAARLPVADRLPLLSETLRVGAVAPVVALLVAVVPVALTWSLAPSRVILGFAATFLVVASLAPIQDHIRAMLHAGAQSWRAAMVSLLTVPVSIVATATVLASGVDESLLPFGTLGVVHFAALVAGLVFTRRDRAISPIRNLPVRGLVATGRWLLVGGLAPFVGWFVSAALVARLADPASLGLAEAARVASRPLLVVGGGVAAVLAPRIMAAAGQRDHPALRRYLWVSWAVLSGTAIFLLVIIGWGWAGNAVAALMPRAYEVGGLVAFFLLAHLLLVFGWNWRYELLGLGREKRAAAVDVAGAGAMLIVSLFAASSLGSWTVPLATSCFAVVVLAGYWLSLGALESSRGVERFPRMRRLAREQSMR